MLVLQFAKRSVLTLAAAAVALSGCGSESAPTVPFNPSGATADIEAVNSTFASSAFSDFSALSVLFDAALGGAPLVSASAAALDLRGGGTAKGIQAAAARSAERIARIVPRPAGAGFSASSAAIPPEFLGKTFVYSGGSYVVSAQTGAPANGVRFRLYAIDPVTLLPVEPLNQTGYVDLIDLSSGTTSSARVIVVSGTTTYLDYRVSATSTATEGRVTVLGFITDGATDATFNLRATLTADAGLTLSYSLDVPQRDLSLDLTMSVDGTEISTINVTLDMRGQNGWVRLTGQFTADGGTLNIAINGTPFATITSTAGAEPVITGADGQPLAQDELDALQRVFEFSGS
ncbi:MAG TPA: hypothetical protein VGQ24_01160, partial [Gemmatimonadales bacterium]|nr:hypothetical protein [Gemmatimonadales bacterium]